MEERAVEDRRPQEGPRPWGDRRPAEEARPGRGHRLPGPFLRVYGPEGKGPRPENAVVASVLYYRRGGYTVLWPNRGPEHHGRPSPLARPYSVVEVALGKHRSSFAMELPAVGGAAFFQTEVDVTWEVVDPHLVAQAQVRDVAELIEPELKDRLREVSWRFRITQAVRAYAAIQERMRSGEWEPLGRDIGLRTRVYVRVDLDARTIDQAKESEDEEREDDRVARRTTRFRELIEAGDYAQFAHMMASKPDNAEAILQMLREERRADRREAQEFVLHMIEQGMIEPRHVSDQTRAVIDYVRESSGRFLELDVRRIGRPRPAARPAPRALPGPAHDEGPQPWDEFDPSDVHDDGAPRDDRDRDRDRDQDQDRDRDRDRSWDRGRDSSGGGSGGEQGSWSDAFESWADP